MLQMDLVFWTFVFHIINAVILYFILRKLLFKPVKKFLDSRETRFKSRYAELDERQDKIEEMEALYNRKLDEARNEAKEILDQANQSAKEHMKEAHNKAATEAQELLERGRKQIESEREHVMEELQVETAKLSVEIASKILQKNIDKKDNQQLIEEFLERVK